MKQSKYMPIVLLLATLFLTISVANIQATNERYVDKQVYENDVLGVALSYPLEYQIHEHQYLSDAYGFVVADNNNFPIFHVSWLHKDSHEKMDHRIQETLANFSGIAISKTPIEVAGERGVKLSPVPGVVAGTLIYLTVNDRLYTLLYANDSLDDLGRSLIDSIRFYESHRSLEELQLTHQDDVLFMPPHLEEALDPPDSEKLPLPGESSLVEPSSGMPAPSSLAPGCDFYDHIVQTQWGSGRTKLLRSGNASTL